MPELPEVEVTRRSLDGLITQAVILDLALGKVLRWPLGVEKKRIIGRQIIGTRRRGKYLLLDLDQGLLIIHLGMSGSLAFHVLGNNVSNPAAHDHFDLHTSRGLLRLTDPRRFGAVVYAESESSVSAQKLLGHLGLEPLDHIFTASGFAAQLALKRASIKSVLLAGRVVVGIGNIYACEVLFLAGIHPESKAYSLSFASVVKLHAAIQQVLTRSIKLGGSTLRNFSNVGGQHGTFQDKAYVYGRAGQACRICTTNIELLQQCQRSTYFCPSCQMR
jgi:formamidopyrimidine-DNA glycosylase